MNKPSIVAIVSQRVELRKAGKEYKGLCPFHADKTPSFTVNEEKGVFYCFGCQVGGDVIDFVMQMDGVGFPDAIKSLGVEGGTPRRQGVSREAVIITDWCNAQELKAQSLLREIGRRVHLAHEAERREEVQFLCRESEILGVLADDLQDPRCAMALFESRAGIEKILEDAEPEALPEFPPLTPEYRERLSAYVVGDA